MKKELMLSIIQKRWVMLCLFVMMCIFGYYSWKQLSIEAYPDIADVTSQVVTQVPGLAAEEVEQQITIPLERAINGLPGMHVMRSKSTFGLSMITIVFKDGTEDYWSRQRVQERLNEVELPYGAVPGLDPLTSPVGEVYRYIIESDQHSLRELTDLQNWVIIPRIKEVSGVADVTNFGGITTQFQVEVDPSKLEQYNLSLSQVVEAIENNNANVGGSVLNRGDLGYVVRGIGLIGNLDDLGHIVVSTTSGVPVFLNDIGSLKYGNLERKGVLGYTDRTRNYSESLEGIVLLLKHENPSKVLEDIHVAVDELNNETLPEGVRIHTFLDRTNLVDTTLSTVSHTLLMGMALVVLVLILFLGNWRGALLVSITIPVSLLIAFILMHLTDIPANLLSLGAIDFGIIVDGAIVMLETILKKREDNPKQYLEEKSMAQRAKEVGRPILFSTIVIITAYLPLFAFERVERKLFTPMAFTMSYAMIGALLVALLLIPGLAYAIYRKPHKIYKNKWLDRLKDKYIRTITRFLEAPLKAIIPSGLILTAGIVLSVVVGKDFLPELDEGSIWLQVNLPPGISVEKSRELSDTLRARTMKYSEVTYIMVQAGRNDDGTDPFTPSHFEVSIGIKPYDEWPKGKTKKDLIHELEEEYKLLPGFKVGFSQPMIDGVMDKIAGAHSELVVKVYGEDFRETRRIAEEITRALGTVKGAVDLDIDQEPPLPQLQIIMNRDAIARYGLNVSDVADLIEVAIGGKAIAQLYQGDRQYDITCKYKEEMRDTPEKIAGLMDKLGFKEGEVLEHSMLSKSVERAQKKVEENNFGIRKRLLEYDDVMNSQRNVIYTRRRHALMGERIGLDVLNTIYDTSVAIVDQHADGDYEGFKLELFKTFAMECPFTEEEFKNGKADKLADKLFDEALQLFKRRMERMTQVANPVIKQVYEHQGAMYENIMIPITDGKRMYNVSCNLKEAYETESKAITKAFQKSIVLHTIDEAWKEHLREMDELRHSVQNASYENKDPLLIYKLESYNLFKNMVDMMNRKTAAVLMRGQIPVREEPTEEEKQAMAARQAAMEEAARQRIAIQRAEAERHQDMSKYRTEKTDISGNNNPEERAQQQPRQEPVRAEKRVGRNDPCPCGSGKKYKNCHGQGL